MIVYCNILCISLKINRKAQSIAFKSTKQTVISSKTIIWKSDTYHELFLFKTTQLHACNVPQLFSSLHVTLTVHEKQHTLLE